MREIFESFARFVISLAVLVFYTISGFGGWLYYVIAFALIIWILLPFYEYFERELREWVKKRWK
jgi:hypothetical protein